VPGVSGGVGAVGVCPVAVLAGPVGTVRHQPRRARCTSCGGTHVLLSALWLLRRADAAVVIGAALEGQATGKGHRPLAAASGRPVSTVRGWLRRFVARAEHARVKFTRLLHALDPVASALTPRGSVVADALEAIGRAAAAAVVRLSPVGPWEFAARASAGRLLAPPAGAGW
jgi:hypothetical protein